MSRILRRPMFRGGKVSSYGNGIATGLANGGRVNLGTGGSPFGAPITNVPQAPYDSGRTTGSGRGLTKGNLLQRSLAKIKRFAGNPITTASRMAPAGIMSMAGVPLIAGGGIGTIIGAITDNIVKAGDTPEAYAYRKKAVRDDPFAYSETDLEINPKDGTMTTRGQAIDDEIARLDVGEKYGFLPRGGPEARLKEMGLEGQFDTSGNKIQKIIEEQIEKPGPKTNYNNQFRKTSTEPEESTELSKADLEKRKELFAELLGGGKARGEDISNMLMSFAGKALKPEATVKGAFGEFFEEEAKRPSSKTKIDQAAAQLAINDYIAGKRSKEQTKALLAQLKVKAKLGTADLYENITKIAGPGSNPTVSNLESALKVTEDTRGKPVTKIKSTDKIEIEEKDHDSFFIYEDTKRIVYIDSNGNEVPIY